MHSSAFSEEGYIIVRSVIEETERLFLFDYIQTKLRAQKLPKGDPQVPGTPCAYGDFAMETLLEKLLPDIERRTGLALYPTYSYMRLYKNGDELKRHTDRAACEISATLCLGYAPDTPWPIWVESRVKTEVSLNPGDMLIYKGIEVAHWREKYPGDKLAQVFLHYVDQHGPFAEWKFDKRVALRKPPVRYDT